jgi:invasion protein IalB
MKIIAALSAVLLMAAVPAAAVAGEAKPNGDLPFGDWVLHCTKLGSGEQACALHQKILAKDTKLPVAAFALARGKDSHELRLAAILPLGLDIPAGVTGTAGAAPLPFTIQTCVRRGCIASTRIDDKLLETLRGSDAFSVTFKMRVVADQTTVPVSLKGLDEGLKALDAK